MMSKSIQKTEHATPDLAKIAMVNLLSALASAADDLMKLRDNTIPKTPRDYVHPYSFELDPSSYPGTLFFTFSYTHHELISSFHLPVYTDIKDKELDELVGNDSQENTTCLQENKSSLYDKFFSILFKPISMSVMSIVFVANLVNIIALLVTGSALLPMIFGSSVFVGLAVLGVGLLYFVPAVFYNVAKYKLKNELLEKFKKIVQHLSDGEYLFDEIRWYKKLPLKYRIILHENFPDNKELRWWYYYLRALIAVDEKLTGGCGDIAFSVEQGLKLSDTLDQKFLLIRAIVNENDLSRKDYREVTLREYSHKEYHKVCEIIETRRLAARERIKPYIEQIPLISDSTLHKKYAADVHAALHEIIECLSNLQYKEANIKFIKMVWNGYCKAAFPGAAIIYYQIEAIMRLIERSDDNNETRIFSAQKSFVKVKRYIDAHFPEESQVFQNYFDSYDAVQTRMYKIVSKVEGDFTVFSLRRDRSKTVSFTTGKIARTASLSDLRNCNDQDEAVDIKHRVIRRKISF